MNTDIQDTIEITSPVIKRNLGNILIVEDESLIGWSIGNILKRAGYRVTVVESGEEALGKINSTRFDIVVTDFMLPKINGFEVAAHVKSLYPKAPVVLMSAYEESKAMLNLFTHTVDYYIQKPFALSEIITVVRRFIAQRDKNDLSSASPSF
ncbi:MAG: response regulator [Ignavibacteriales bacterium]|nr:response regulator [Ignavibacteriales bacterium]